MQDFATGCGSNQNNKARRRCGEVFRYAIVTGRAKYNPAPDLADANVMKGRKIHVVPMSDQVVELLTTLSSITKPVSEFVFAGRNDKKKPICENAVLLVIKQIGYEGLESGHGFRHEFSTIMNEHEWPADAIEVRLAHANGGSVRGIYNHAQYLDKRREMMQWWADWIDEKVG